MKKVVDEQWPGGSVKGKCIGVIAGPGDVVCRYAGHTLHRPVPGDDPARTINGKGRIGEMTEDIGDPAFGFTNVLFEPVFLHGAPDRVSQFCELRPDLAAFLDVKVGSFIERLDHHFLSPPAGKDDEGDRNVGASQSGEQVYPVHTGHLVIGDDGIEFLDLEQPECLLCRPAGGDLHISGTFEIELSQFKDDRFVVNVEDTHQSRSPPIKCSP